MSIEKYFDNNWENVNFSNDKREHIDVILYFINKYIQKKSLNYFEFGCGNCYVTNFLFNQLSNNFENISFHVSDISKVGLSKCNDNFFKKLVSKEKMSFSALYNSMDIVSSFEVFEHLTKELEKFYLNELLHISNEYILIGVPYTEKLEKRNVVCKACGYDGHIYGHLRSYNMDGFSNLFEDNAKLIEYKLCGVGEKDFDTKNYYLAKKMTYKILNFTCPNCVQEQNEISYVNRVKNKVISTLLLNKRIYKTETHPFWIVGIFKKVGANAKK